MKLNNSMYTKATAQQLFLVDLDIEKKKQRKAQNQEQGKEKEKEVRIKSDRFIETNKHQAESSVLKGKKFFAGKPLPKNHQPKQESVSYLNTQGNLLSENLPRQIPTEPADAMVGSPEAPADDWKLSGPNPPKTPVKTPPPQNPQNRKKSIGGESRLSMRSEVYYSQQSKLSESESKRSAKGTPGNDKMCNICFERESNSAFMPCGHGSICNKCAVEIFDKRGVCPLCRTVRHA